MWSYGRQCPSISLKRKIKLRPAHSSKSTTGPWVNNRISDNDNNKKKKREDVARPQLNQTKFQTPGIRGFPSLTMGSPVKEAWLVWHSLSPSLPLSSDVHWKTVLDATTDALDHVQMLCISQRDLCPISAIHFSLPAACFPPDSHSRVICLCTQAPPHVPYGLIHRPLCCGGGMKKGMHYGQCCKYKKEAK